MQRDLVGGWSGASPKDPVTDEQGAEDEYNAGYEEKSCCHQDRKKIPEVMAHGRQERGHTDLEALRLGRSKPSLEPTSAGAFSDIRRLLLRLSDFRLEEARKLLARNDHCAPDLLHDLGRTPRMRERMRHAGFMMTADESYQSNRVRPTRSREVLVKFGVEVPKPAPRLPPTVRIGAYRRTGRTLRLDRQELFERVWSEPVEQLAKGWGLSGRGLAKACKRLRIPVPPRGFWARVQGGQRVRRPQLPELPAGEAEEIVVAVPE